MLPRFYIDAACVGNQSLFGHVIGFISGAKLFARAYLDVFQLLAGRHGNKSARARAWLSFKFLSIVPFVARDQMVDIGIPCMQEVNAKLGVVTGT